MSCEAPNEMLRGGGGHADEGSSADACDRAFDELAEQLQLPPLALRSHLDAAMSELRVWRDLAEELGEELQRLQPPAPPPAPRLAAP